MACVRPEVLRRPGPDGAVELLDLLLEQAHVVPSALAAALEDGAHPARPALEAWCAARCLDEGPAASALRAGVWAARARGAPSAPPSGARAEVPAAAVAELPAVVAGRWRRPEAWRRLAEAARAGERLLRLDGFLAPARAAAWRARLARAPQEPMETALLRASRVRPGHAALAPAAALMGHPALRAAVGAVLGRALAPGPLVNGWCLPPGGHMGVHPDGPTYAATFVLGLEADWAAADGGAIAFGWPEDDGFRPWERWLPHAGDLLVFTPSALSFHCVEPPARPRVTLSGWWRAPPAGEGAP